MAKDKFALEYAVVFGNRCSEFPMDMLRYDRCFPASEEEAHKAERIAQSADEPRFRAVVVARHAGSPARWTPARWSSFGWELVNFKTDSLREAQDLAKKVEKDGPPPCFVGRR